MGASCSCVLLLLLPLLLLACGPRPAREESGASLRVTSPAFAEGGLIPPRFTADGAGVSPPLEWSAGPPGTASYALICEDPDAPAGLWVHWVLWNLEEPALAEGAQAAEAGAVEGRNSWGRTGYGGPAPPSGTHRYFFRVYALDRPLDLPAEAGREDLLRGMEGHILARGTLMGRYRRGS